MKTFLIILLSLLVIIGLGGFIFYKFYLPDLVAEAIIHDETPPYVPEHVKAKIEKLKVPINQASEDLIQEIHKSNITLEEVIKAIDETQETQVYSAVDELNDVKAKNTNEVFDIAKKHLHADFDLEVLREPFNKNVNMKMINKAMNYLNSTRNEGLDPETMKAIAKKVLIEKEKEYNAMLGN
jgi:hypothetical protein